MFADSLLDSPWPSRSRRVRATLASFALQALLLACALALPLIFTEAVPQLQSMAKLVAPSQSPATLPSTPAPSGGTTAVVSSNAIHLLQAPSRVPRIILPGDPAEAPAGVLPAGALPQGPAYPKSGNDVLGATGSRYAPYIPPPPPQAQHPPRITSTMMEGSLIYRVEPPYPFLAKTAGVQGTVELAAVISREGKIMNLQVVSGHPLLVRAAVDAVSQWRYRPYVLNGEPVEVETKITVNFLLSGR